MGEGEERDSEGREEIELGKLGLGFGKAGAGAIEMVRAEGGKVGTAL